MKPLKRCKRILVEQWTPGNRQSPDGPSRDMEGRCVEYEGHEGDHVYGDWYERGTVR